MKLWHKFILLGFVFFIGLGLILGLSFVHTSEVQKRVTDLKNAEELMVLAEEIVWLDEVLTQSTRNYIFTGDIVWKKRYDQYGEVLDKHIAEAKNLSQDSFEKELFIKQDKANIALVDMELKIHNLVKNKKVQEAKKIIESKDYDYWKIIYSETIKSFQSYSKKKLININQKASDEINDFIYKTIFGLLVISLLYFVLSYKVSQGFYKSLMELKRGVEKVQRGDFSYRVQLNTDDEVQDIAESFNHMASYIGDLINDVNKATKAKDMFLANMSHEIRTPLNGMIGVLEVLEEDNLNDLQKEKISTIRSSGELLLEVVSEILDYSKIEQEVIEIEKVDFELREFFQDSLKLMAGRAGEKGIQLNLDGSGEYTFRGDMIKLRKILNNLLSNAIKFTENGQVSIEYIVSENQDIYFLQMNIKDSGIGIPEHIIEKIFEPFRQADISTTRNYGGTGLGLSISLKLTQVLGGSLTCQSVDGEGSCFTFEGYFEKGEKKSVTTDEAPQIQNFASLKVLLVEDNLINQKVIVMMLNQLDVEFDLANNGQEALDKISTVGPTFYSLIFMDLQMPVMGGLEATKTLKSEYGEKLSPIVALTANTFDDDRRQCLNVGMSDFLPKPIKKQALIKLLVEFSSNKKQNL